MFDLAFGIKRIEVNDGGPDLERRKIEDEIERRVGQEEADLVAFLDADILYKAGLKNRRRYYASNRARHRRECRKADGRAAALPNQRKRDTSSPKANSTAQS
jgi:hypothetical protein